MSAGTDVRAGELPAVPDASNSINRRALLVPDRGNGSTGLLRGCTSDSKSGSLIWQPLSRKRPKMRSSPQQQRRGLDRQATLHTIYEEKDSKYGGYSGEHPTKFLWKTIEKISNSIRFYMLLGTWRWRTVACAEENAPGSTRIIQKGRTITHQTRRQQYQGNTLI